MLQVRSPSPAPNFLSTIAKSRTRSVLGKSLTWDHQLNRIARPTSDSGSSELSFPSSSLVTTRLDSLQEFLPLDDSAGGLTPPASQVFTLEEEIPKRGQVGLELGHRARASPDLSSELLRIVSRIFHEESNDSRMEARWACPSSFANAHGVAVLMARCRWVRRLLIKVQSKEQNSASQTEDSPNR